MMMVTFFSNDKWRDAPPTKWMNWEYRIAEGKHFENTVKIIPYIKEYAGVPPEQDILDQEKTNKLVKATIKRKRAINGYTAGISLSFSAATLAFLFSLLDEKQLRTDAHNLSISAYVLITIGIFSLIRNHYLLKDKGEIHFTDYLSDKLSQEQKTKIIECLETLKYEKRSVYSVGNQERFYQICKELWTTENWFLLFTENENDRRAICLNRIVPSGKIYISKAPVAIDEETKKSEPQKEKLLFNPKIMYSEETELVKTIEFIEKKCDPNFPPGPYRLTKFRRAWLEALKMLLKQFAAYKPYLSQEITSVERKEFLKHFYPIFAPIADNYKEDIIVKMNAAGKKEEAINANFGHAGTDKFLEQRHENLHNWLNKLYSNE